MYYMKGLLFKSPGYQGISYLPQRSGLRHENYITPKMSMFCKVNYWDSCQIILVIHAEIHSNASKFYFTYSLKSFEH